MQAGESVLLPWIFGQSDRKRGGPAGLTPTDVFFPRLINLTLTIIDEALLRGGRRVFIIDANGVAVFRVGSVLRGPPSTIPAPKEN